MYYVIREIIMDNDRDIFVPIAIVASFAGESDARRIATELNLIDEDCVFTVVTWTTHSNVT
jgi:hypothetical protein